MMMGMGHLVMMRARLAIHVVVHWMMMGMVVHIPGVRKTTHRTRRR